MCPKGSLLLITSCDLDQMVYNSQINLCLVFGFLGSIQKISYK